MSNTQVAIDAVKKLYEVTEQRNELLKALIFAKEMMIVNDLSLPRTFEVIDEAIAKAKGEE